MTQNLKNELLEIKFFHCLVPFIKEWIRNNRKVLVIIDELTREEIIKYLINVLKTTQVFDNLPGNKLSKKILLV